MATSFVKIGQFTFLAIVFLALVASDSWAQKPGRILFSSKGQKTSQNFDMETGWIENLTLTINEITGIDQKKQFLVRNTSPYDVEMTVTATLTVGKGYFEFILFNGDGSEAVVLSSQEGQTVTQEFEAKSFGENFKYQVRAKEASSVSLKLNFKPH
ncbi:MAG: hypothetical protein LBI10_03970 [Deltaproteobacteria bacterium]|jgi:hypothetical protein|nr:hypothetical protein [Deltaproteobacteria bacterium]